MKIWRRRTLKQQWAIVLASFVVVPLVIVGLEAAADKALDAAPAAESISCSSWTFDRGRWSATESERGYGVTERERLAEGLRKCGTLKGTDRAGVVALLGRPDRRGRRVFDYFIGAGMVGDAEWLIVSFGDAGRVKRVQIFT